MPRISFRDYQSGHKPWYDYIGDAGRQIAGGVAAAHENAREDEQLAAKQKDTDRHLAIEEENAKARVLAEANRAQTLAEREARQEADRQAAVQGLQELAGLKQQDAVRKGIDAAIASPGGALGPFGAMARVASGAASGIAKTQAEFAPKIELARTMSPAGARMYLERETREAKQEAVGEAYQREAQVVMAGVTDGVISPEIAKGMVEALQTGLRSGQLPGRVHQQVAKAYDLHAKVQKRLAGWEESDRKAGEVVAMLEKMAQGAEDPKTRQKLMEKVADAKGEWGRTQVQSFREKNDGADELAKLEQIVFGAQALNDELPKDIEYAPPPMELGVEPGREGELRQVQAAAAQNRTTSLKSPGSYAPGQSAPTVTTVKPAEKAELGKAVTSYVASNGRLAVSQGTDQPSEIKKLRLGLAKQLGLAPTDPFLEGALTDALLRLQRGELQFNEAAKPKGKSAPTLGESLEHLHPGAGGM